MISFPSDYPSLDVEHEWQNLQQALAPLIARGVVALDRLEGASLLALQHRLRKIDYHIFHFIGHGGFDERAQDGVLLMQDDQGRGRPVPGQYLGALLHDEEHLRLVVLNACEGGRTGSADPFAGSAQSLVQQGLPAVIAMQFEVTDGAAITFAREFYAAVADGLAVDEALSEARKGIFATGNDIEWGTPVLYLRVPDGRLFDIAAPAEKGDGTPAQKQELNDSQVSFQVDQLYFQALNAFFTEDFKQAIELFTQVTTLRPNYLDAQQKLAEARRKQELPALRQQAESAQQAGKWTSAVSALEKIAELDPEDDTIQGKLAQARLQAQLASLYANVRQLCQSKKWAAALRAFEQIDAPASRLPRYRQPAGDRAAGAGSRGEKPAGRGALHRSVGIIEQPAVGCQRRKAAPGAGDLACIPRQHPPAGKEREKPGCPGAAQSSRRDRGAAQSGG